MNVSGSIPPELLSQTADLPPKIGLSVRCLMLVDNGLTDFQTITKR
jgi:hypothetical protein